MTTLRRTIDDTARRAIAARTEALFRSSGALREGHFVLKSGCRIERLQLETVQRLDRALATYAVVAWRLLWLTYEARRDPDRVCAVSAKGVIRIEIDDLVLPVDGDVMATLDRLYAGVPWDAF